MKTTFALLTLLLATNAHATGSGSIECTSKNISMDLSVPYGSFSMQKFDVLDGRIDFLGDQIIISRLDALAQNRASLTLTKTGPGIYELEYFGGYGLLIKTGIYKFRMSITRDHLRVYGVNRKIPIEESDLLEEGQCSAIGV